MGRTLLVDRAIGEPADASVQPPVSPQRVRPLRLAVRQQPAGGRAFGNAPRANFFALEKHAVLLFVVSGARRRRDRQLAFDPNDDVGHKNPCLATPRPAQPRHASPSAAVPSRAMPRRAAPCPAQPRHALPRRAPPRPALPCPAYPRRALPSPAPPRPATPRHAEPFKPQTSPA